MNSKDTTGNPAARKPSGDDRKAKGRRAEQIAADYMAANGYAILERNWRCRTGELDLIASQGDDLVIVEVRSRSVKSASFGTPSESMTPRKIRQVRETAAVYLHMANRSAVKIRFDMIGIILRPDGEPESINHIVAAF